MAKSLKTQIKVRRDTEENMQNIQLADGEPGYTTDTHVFAIGDGKHTFKELVSTFITSDIHQAGITLTEGDDLSTQSHIVFDRNNESIKFLFK